MADHGLATAEDGSGPPGHVPQAAAWLGGLGLIPFVAGAALVISTDVAWAYDGLRYYAASILSFMGGVQWGLAIAAAKDDAERHTLWSRLSASVAPALIAWLALLLSEPFDLAMIALAFGLLLLSDLSAVRQGWAPFWYRRLRIPLTAVVLLTLIAATLTTASS